MAAGNKQRRDRYIRYSGQGWTKFAFDSCIKCPPLDQRTQIWTQLPVPVHWEETSLLFCWSLCLPQAKSWTESILKFREIWKKFIFLNYWTRTSQSYVMSLSPSPLKVGESRMDGWLAERGREGKGSERRVFLWLESPTQAPIRLTHPLLKPCTDSQVNLTNFLWWVFYHVHKKAPSDIK